MKLIQERCLRPSSIVFFLWLGLCPLVHADSKVLQQLASGVPAYYERELPASSYVEVHTRRLAHARVVWVDFELLREMGVEVPVNGLTFEFEQQLLDAFAFAVPREQDEQGMFTSEEKTYYADRYGGGGLDANFGSGRAGAAGKFQTKGLGRTSLVGEHADFNHAHGGASLAEATSEATWGQYNQKRLPFGGNRVALLIDTGTYTEWEDGGREPRALIVRQDPLRPAHFGEVLGSKGRLSASDPERTRAAVARFERALPQPAGATAATRLERINLGLKEYVRRIAQQYSTAYAMRIYHGATSPSNMEVTGRFIDYGTQTTQPGYGPVQTLSDNDPFGKTEEFKAWLIRDFLLSVRKYADAEVLEGLLSDEKLFEHFDAEYESHLRQELAALAGMPPELASALKSRPSAQRFRDIFKQVAEAGTSVAGVPSVIDIDKRMPEQTGVYRVPEILTRLARGEPIENELSDAALREHFLAAYTVLMQEALALARADGVSENAFRRYVAHSAALRNRVEAEFFRPSMRWESAELVKRYKATGRRELIWDAIDEQINVGDLHLDDPRSYQLVLDEKLNRITGESYRHVFDARENRLKVIYRTPLLDSTQSYNVEENTISRSDLEQARVHSRVHGAKQVEEGTVHIGSDAQAEFEVPGSDVELILVWRHGKEKMRITFAASASMGRCEQLLRD
ncbi:MAG: hypothetical protein HY074_19995 [Deltaproteobacteria bacterium]|nr:hypothetical protein [Deltaproteobacteria bacterium]